MHLFVPRNMSAARPMPTRRTTRVGIVVAVTGLLLGCLVVAGSTASAAAAHVTVKVIGKVAVGPGERARVTPRYSIRKGVTIRSAKISVRRGSTWVARGARSARLPAGTYRVTSRVSYRVRGTSGLGHVRTAKRTQTLRVVTVRAPVVRAADASPPVMPPAAVPPAPEASSLSTTGAACDAGSLRKPDGSPWVCSFSDEFSGTALDRGTWTPQLTAASGYHIGADCYVDDPENIAVGGGVLALTVRQQAGEFACTTPGGSRPAQATAGMVSTYDSFAQAHGRFEIRAAFPETTVAGHHGALWLFGKDMSGVEIDIAELYSNYADRVIPYVHYASGADTTVTNPYCLVNRPSDFHTYTLEWTATAMSIAYDGTVCLTHRINGESPGASSPFDAPFMLVLTQGLGLGENAATASTPAVGTTRIDYVRVWR